MYISAYSPIKCADYDGRTPLHVAASRRHLNMCQILIKSGEDMNARDNFGNTALEESSQESFQDFSRHLESRNTQYLGTNETNNSTLNTFNEVQDFSADVGVKTKRMLLTVIVCNFVSEGNLI